MMFFGFPRASGCGFYWFLVISWLQNRAPTIWRIGKMGSKVSAAPWTWPTWPGPLLVPAGTARCPPDESLGPWDGKMPTIKSYYNHIKSLASISQQVSKSDGSWTQRSQRPEESEDTKSDGHELWGKDGKEMDGHDGLRARGWVSERKSAGSTLLTSRRRWGRIERPQVLPVDCRVRCSHVAAVHITDAWTASIGERGGVSATVLQVLRCNVLSTHMLDRSWPPANSFRSR